MTKRVRCQSYISEKNAKAESILYIKHPKFTSELAFEVVVDCPYACVKCLK